MNHPVVEQKMSVPFVDLRAQWRALAPEIRPAIERVLENANFILSAEVGAFENNFASFLGSRHCVGVGSGTDALMLALEALGIGAGDDVLVPANTYVATAAAVCHRGARPVFVDIDPDSFLMDSADAKAKCTRRTRAIIPVHLYGRAMDLTDVLIWATQNQIRVVEDACQAHGARIGGQAAGARGDAGCFSFYPGKNLGCYGDGGAVVTGDAIVADKIASLRNQGEKEKYRHIYKGYNSRLDALQAAILNVKLAHLGRSNDLRRKWAAYYDEGLRDLDCIIRPSWTASAPLEHIFHLYVVRVPKRDGLLQHLRANGVSAQIHYPLPVHLQEGYRDLGFASGDLPVAEKAAKEILSLPIYPELTEEQADHVLAQVKEFYAS